MKPSGIKHAERNQKIRQYLLDLPELTPAEIVARVDSYGYIGQDRAKKALALMAFRHINRLKKIFLENVPEAELPTKNNFLLVGPTGSGKTYLVELLFERILQLPTVIVDITTYSETGYVGQDAPSLLTRLVNAANDDYELASIGLICIDEFDKIASGQNNALFSGQGTTKDVSGLGVQKELLKMLESAEVDVPKELTHSSWASRQTFRTDHVAFIACGAFSGLKRLIDFQSKDPIGFGKGSAPLATQGNIAFSLDPVQLHQTRYFESYGMLPELIARFARIVPFQPLLAEDLKLILKENVIQQYQKELTLANMSLEIEDPVYQYIVEDAMERETGARGIKHALLEYLEEALFEAYSQHHSHTLIRLYMDAGKISWELEI